VAEEPVAGGREAPAEDPVTSKSYSFSLLVWSSLLVFTLAWALYDEMYGLRPWRSYQPQFATAYQAYLLREIPKQRDAQTAILNSAEYQKLEAAEKAALEEATKRTVVLDARGAFLDGRLAALTDTYQTARARVTALAYQWEIAGSESAKKARQKEVEDAKKEPCSGLIGRTSCRPTPAAYASPVTWKSAIPPARMRWSNRPSWRCSAPCGPPSLPRARRVRWTIS